MFKADERKKTLIFDFDGTIADTFEHVLDVLDQYSGDFGVELSDKKLLEDLRSLSAEELFRKFMIPKIFVPFIVRKVQKNLRTHIKEIFPFSDVVEEIKKLKPHYNIGIVTSNSKDNVIAFLKKENIEDLFEFVLGEPNLFGKHKILNKAFKQFKINKEEAVYIGDEARDIDAAINAGIKIISVGWGFNSKKLLVSKNPDYYIDTPAELTSAINRIFKP